MYASPVSPLPYKVRSMKAGAYSTFGAWKLKWKSGNESRPVMSDSLRPHGLYSPWNSPGQNTGVGSRSHLQGIFPAQGSNPGLLHCRQILYQLSQQGSPLGSWSEVNLLSRVRLCVPTIFSLPGSSIHGIFQARVLEWVAISFSTLGSSRCQISRLPKWLAPEIFVELINWLFNCGLHI